MRGWREFWVFRYYDFNTTDFNTNSIKMYQYGQMIGDGMNLGNLNIYSFFVYYFDNPLMKRIKTVGNQYLYACKVPTLLVKDKKYIIAIVDINKSPKNQTITLDQINWSTLQIRVLDENYDAPIHGYIDKNDEISLSQISIREKNDKMYRYSSVKLPSLKIYLVFSKNQTRNFSDSGTLKVAIEMFSTIFSL
jgi:hypothetical protein